LEKAFHVFILNKGVDYPAFLDKFGDRIYHLHVDYFQMAGVGDADRGGRIPRRVGVVVIYSLRRQNF